MKRTTDELEAGDLVHVPDGTSRTARIKEIIVNDIGERILVLERAPLAEMRGKPVYVVDDMEPVK